MITEQKLLKRAAVVTVLIALTGIGLLYLITWLADEGSHRLLDFGLNGKASPSPALTAESPAAVEDDFFTRLEAERAFIRHVFPLISAWNLERVQPYFAVQTLQQSRQNNTFNEVFAALSSELGKLVGFAEPGFVLPPALPDGRREANLSEYEFMAYYEKGNALVNVVVQGQADQHAVYALTISVMDDGRDETRPGNLILADRRGAFTQQRYYSPL